MMNRLANVNNSFQGDYRRVLCVCSAGLLRSPTAAWVLSQSPFNFNTRAAGLTPEFALVPVDRVLLTWAHEIVCMEAKQEQELMELLKQNNLSGTRITCLHIPDSYAYRDPELIDLISLNYEMAHDQGGPNGSQKTDNAA